MNARMGLESDIIASLKRVRAGGRELALCSSDVKNRALARLATALRESQGEILTANARDLEQARAQSVRASFLERLTLNPARIESMALSVEQVAALPDPVGEVIAGWRRPNGLEISQVRVPIGTVAIVYEARPNVTVEAAVLALKAGNGAVLRGGKESLVTNRMLADLIGQAMEQAGAPAGALFFVPTPEREVIQILKHATTLVDLIIPRGGAALKEALAGSEIAVLPHFDGICHVYVDRSANAAKAEEICFNAKCGRPSVCNAMENLLVHAGVADSFLPRLAARMAPLKVELRGCPRTLAILRDARPATESDWDTEYLDLILSIKVVDSIDEAIDFIGRHGSGLADAIVTEDLSAAARFEREVDSATVYVNASTRFTDGFEFGFGAETGISTNRLHARGPMGLRELTTYKYVIRGNGQVRI
jgi:glutamate-5-semialdehyde dehydrogenase